MERKQVIKRYGHVLGPDYYINGGFTRLITNAYLCPESKTERLLNKLSSTYPGYIWEIKTVYHV